MVLSGTDRWRSLGGAALCASMLLTAGAGPAVAQRTITRNSDASLPPSPPAAAPVVRAVMPNRFEAGKTYSVTISGAGFAPGMTVNFSPPGVGVAGPVAVQGGTAARLRVQIASGAAPGFRTLEITVPTVAPGTGAVALPGKPLSARLMRAVEIVGSPAGQSAPPPLDSMPPLRTPSPAPSPAPPPAPPPGDGQTPLAVPTPAPPPMSDKPAAPVIAAPLPPGYFARVTRIVPSSGEPGGTYTLELQGVALAPGVRFGFGPDIEIIGAPQMSGMGHARQTVRIRPAAAPGVRRLQLAAGPQAPFIDQAVRFDVTVALT